MIFASRMLTFDTNDSTGVIATPFAASPRSGVTRTTSPVRAASRGGTLKTPGRTVAIWVGESLVMIVAMMLPPRAGRVCLRIPTRFWPPFA